MATQGLRVIEDFAVETGGVQDGQRLPGHGQNVPAHRRIALDRLLNRVNATADHDHRYAFLIFGQEPDDIVVRTYERLRSHNPVPVRLGACGDGWHTRNLPIDRIIGGPVFRGPETDCLLQVAGLVALALLWREEVPAGSKSDAFAVLSRALNLRASRHDLKGVVRR